MALSENYQKALRALQDQAEAMSALCIKGNDRKAALTALHDAQRRITEVLDESRHIVALVLNSTGQRLTIPSTTEADIEALLAEQCHYSVRVH